MPVYRIEHVMRTALAAAAFAALALALAHPAAARASNAADRPADWWEDDEEIVPSPQPGLAQDYDPAPALWRLSDADTTIYLMGTVHLLPPGFRWRNPQLDAVVAEVDELVVETSDGDAPLMMEAVAAKSTRLLAQRTPTSQQLAPAARGKWRSLIEMQGMSFAEVDRLPVMVALMGFGMGSDSGPSSSYEFGVETILEAEFAATGRPVRSIEDTGRVALSLYRLDDRLILPELERELIRWDGRNLSAFLGTGEAMGEAGNWELEHAWARGQLQEAVDLGLDEGKAAAAFNRALLTDRNRRWAGWLAERLEQPGKVLVAVGAAHFEGRGSVLDMLQTRGLSAERLNSPVP
ncbi:TraB/GumN family protein [Alteraurantiacibacter palmitatis]|uniref:TraB/GumN family protein n=1 Tax=Alteraurantiacibacter palmitatis TaxID=2054628 RepID=A0ABV7E174_9SPHN